MAVGQFAIYQLKNTPETRRLRFRPYKAIQGKGMCPRYEDYEQVYVGVMLPQDTPGKIQERFNRQPPRTFTGHSVSVSDVLVLHVEGKDTAYYVEPDGFVELEGFIKNRSSGSQLSIGTGNFQIDGKGGTWHAFDSITIEKKAFFLMEHEKYGKKAAWVVVDEDGKLVADHVRDGFDQSVRQQIKDYLNQNRSKKHESRQRNASPKKQQGRPSVLAKLRQKQAKIAANSRKNSGKD